MSEEKKLKSLLKGRVIKNIKRHRPTEILIEFDDGWRLFIDIDNEGRLEFSVNEGPEISEQ